MRELHWHPNADEWQYYLKGRARMTVFGSGGRARTDDFAAGDVGYVPQGFGHYIENIGTDDLEIVLAFNSAAIYQSISATAWFASNPGLLLSTNFGVPAIDLRQISRRAKPRCRIERRGDTADRLPAVAVAAAPMSRMRESLEPGRWRVITTTLSGPPAPPQVAIALPDTGRDSRSRQDLRSASFHGQFAVRAHRIQARAVRPHLAAAMQGPGRYGRGRSIRVRERDALQRACS